MEVKTLKTIVDHTLVPHSAFQAAARRLEQCFQMADGASDPICIAVVGESRTGKSRALEECATTHPIRRKPEGLYVPILRVKTPSKPTVKGLVELMLQAIGDPRFPVGTENVKTMRLQTLMKHAGTNMVMIDEFQHFYDKASHKVMHHVADWLKILVDDCRVTLVVAGLPSCRAVLDQNEQLGGRFLAPIVMPRFDWTNDDHREEFVGILEAFEQSIGAHFDLPKLDSADMAFRFYCGTGGLIGYLTKVLRQAVWNAIDNQRNGISLKDLAKAHEQAVWNRETLPGISSPFSRSFVPLPSEDLLKKILLIGTPKYEEPEKTRRARGRAPEKARDVLSAS